MEVVLPNVVSVVGVLVLEDIAGRFHLKVGFTALFFLSEAGQLSSSIDAESLCLLILVKGTCVLDPWSIAPY